MGDETLTEISKNQILGDVSGLTMGLLSLAGNISKKNATYEIVRNMLSHLNEFISKALKDQMLSMIKALFQKMCDSVKIGNAKEIEKEVVLDHLSMIYHYLVSVALNLSELPDIREKLKQLLARMVKISRTDPISGLPKDLLSLLIYSFFPASHMYWHPFTGSHQMMPLYIIKE